ncbi:MAG: efflux RND transporter permease subunit, partial [Alphaproteobacteria bacterium]|nr:efflux RND transporter permease subunit [Alphaproteobacteria bacterium]
MNFTHVFIQRPVLASILNALIVIFGVLSFENITFREYPNIEVPILGVEVVYPNASAEVVEYSVTNPIEDALSKVEGLEAMASSTHYERVNISLQLKEESSVDRAMILVRDALSLARQDLPKDVKEPIVKRNAERDSGPPFMAVMISSPTKNAGELYHFAQTSIRNSFRSVKGVSQVQLWGNPYTMKVNLDPKKMYALGVNIDDITNAFEHNNLAFAAGKYRDAIPVILDLSVSTPEEFEKIIIKHKNDKPILLKHVAKIVLEEDTRSFRMRFGGESALVMTLSCASDANALEVSNRAKAELAHVQNELPKDVSLTLVIDQADFIRESLGNVNHSIIEAIVLVMIIIFIFLRNIRASIIPIVTIPIALIGVITILYAFGYSLNTTTLLALVLAVGLVVDDAIVVLENIYRYIEEGLTPLDAAKKGSSEIGFAILAMTVTLASVFTPIAFLSGFTGKLLVEFAVTLSGAVLISGITALTLSPMMCSKLLKSHNDVGGKHYLPQVDVFLEKVHTRYAALLARLFPKKAWLGYGALLLMVSCVWMAMSLPSEMTPKEDRGFIWVYSPPSPGKDLNAQDINMRKIEARLKDIPGIASTTTFMGDWGGTVVLHLTPSSTRSKTASQMAEELMGVYVDFPSVDVYPSSWNDGLPNLSIVEVYGDFGVAVKTTGTYGELEKTMQGFSMKANESGKFKEAFSA